MWELRQERDNPGWKEPVDPSIASLTRQVAEMSQQLKREMTGLVRAKVSVLVSVMEKQGVSRRINHIKTLIMSLTA